MEAREAEPQIQWTLEETLKDWEYRHKEKQIPETLLPHIPEALLAIDRHVDCTEEGLTHYIEKIEAYADPEGDSSQQRQANVLTMLETALTIEDRHEQAVELMKSLATSENANFFSIEDKELDALEDVTVARAFVREVLVDNVRHSRAPLYVKDVKKLLHFRSTEERTSTEKVTLAAKVVHQRYGSLTPVGVYNWFDHSGLFNKTPREIIDNGTEEEVTELIRWCGDSRMQVAT